MLSWTGIFSPPVVPEVSSQKQQDLVPTAQLHLFPTAPFYCQSCMPRIHHQASMILPRKGQSPPSGALLLVPDLYALSNRHVCISKGVYGIRIKGYLASSPVFWNKQFLGGTHIILLQKKTTFQCIMLCTKYSVCETLFLQDHDVIQRTGEARSKDGLSLELVLRFHVMQTTKIAAEEPFNNHLFFFLH